MLGLRLRWWLRLRLRLRFGFGRWFGIWLSFCLRHGFWFHFRRELRFRLRLGLSLNFWLRSWCGRGQFLFVGSAPQRNSRYGCAQGEKEKYNSHRFPTLLPAGGLNADRKSVV